MNPVAFSRSNSAPSPRLFDDSQSPSPHPEEWSSADRSVVWSRLFGALADAIAEDERRTCADAAAEVLFSFGEGETSAEWDVGIWQAFLESAVSGVFDMTKVQFVGCSFCPFLWNFIDWNRDSNPAHVFVVFLFCGASMISHSDSCK